MRFLLASALALATVGPLSAGSVAAQREVESRVSFDAGRAAWDRGAFARALELWSQSYALSPHPMMQINIGNAWLRLGRRSEAASAYRRYLATAHENASQRQDVHALLSRIDPPPAPAGSIGFDPGGGPATWVTLGAASVLGALSVGLWVDMESRFAEMAGGCGSTAQGCADSDVDALASERDGAMALAGLALTGLAAAVVLWIVEGLP